MMTIRIAWKSAESHNLLRKTQCFEEPLFQYLYTTEGSVFTGRNGDALVNCYESQSVVATARTYRYKRNGNFTQEEPAKVAEVAKVEVLAKEEKPEVSEKKE